MSTLTIDGSKIYDYFISGAKKIIYYEKKLNSINVFPVADGDTGTNLALTMKMVIANAKKHMHLNKTLSSISEVATENAYGNSGMIFAQYLNGFASAAQEKTEISISEFADMTHAASEYAYDAVASPKEGTILSVMRDWSNDIKAKLHLRDFEKILQESLVSARAMVEQTKLKLKVLKENNVVDAGAKGFLIFLEGMLEFLLKGKIQEAVNLGDDVMDKHTHHFVDTAVLQNRYCTQLYIETEMDREAIKQALADFGDSLVITGKEKRIKIHIHTDYPGRVVEQLAEQSDILSQKIEDMKLMNNILHHQKSKIGIVTDTIADLSQELIDEYQVSVIPVNLICDSIAYLDKVTMTPDVFYQKIDQFKMNPTSAQPSLSTIEKTFTQLLDHYDSLIGIFVSANMSGTYNSAKKAAAKISRKGKQISVINSRTNSAGEGLLVYEAGKLIAQGLPHQEIVDRLNEARSRIRIYVSVSDLSHMIKGGRISKTAGYILNKINLQPVISIDTKGNGIVTKKTLSQRKAVESIVRQFKQDLKAFGIERYSIVYSDKEEDTEDLMSGIEEAVKQPPISFSPISPVVGLNAGAGSFAVAYMMGGE